jgi:hypothetical protein
MTAHHREALRALVDAHLACTDLFALAEIEDRMLQFDLATREDVWTSLDDAAKEELRGALAIEGDARARGPAAWAQHAIDAALAHEAGDTERAAELILRAANALRQWPAHPLIDLLGDGHAPADADALFEILTRIGELVARGPRETRIDEPWDLYLPSRAFAGALAARRRWRWGEAWLRAIGAHVGEEEGPLARLLRADISRMCRLDGRLADAARALTEIPPQTVDAGGDPDDRFVAEIVERELAIEAALVARARGLLERARELLVEGDVGALAPGELDELREWGDADGAEWLLATLAPGGAPSTDSSP